MFSAIKFYQALNSVTNEPIIPQEQLRKVTPHVLCVFDHQNLKNISRRVVELIECVSPTTIAYAKQLFDQCLGKLPIYKTVSD